MILDVAILALGFALPWAAGAALVAALPRRSADAVDAQHAAWTAGSGFFAGMLLLTLWMRALSALGVPFSPLSIAGPLALVVIGLGALVWRRRRADLRAGLGAGLRALAGEGLEGLARLAWLALLAWLAIRMSLLAIDVLMRPLYPWDAWSQWATKARVWFAYGRIVPFAGATEWFTATTPWVFFDAGPHYPATVPLVQAYAATLIGRFDDALVNVPWWFAGVALAMSVFGALRREGLAPLPALTGAWMVASLPILDVHVALAGYADLWMASFVTVAALAMLAWTRTRSLADAVTALLAATAAALTKNPGIVWVAVLVPGIVVALMPRRGLVVVAAAFAAGVAALAFAVRTGGKILGYRLQADFNLPWSALADAYLMFGNWHLLFFAVVGAALLANRRLVQPALAPLTVVIGAGLAFLFFGFAFTNAGMWVEDQSTVNRATLHLAPLLVVFVVLAFRAWHRSPGWGATAAPTAPVAPPAS